MRARRVLLIVAVALVAGSCTSSTTTTSAQPSTVPPPPTSTVPPAPTGATLADGTSLPAGCPGKAVASETVAFVADGRAWALDPKDGGHLACLFRVRRPGSFAFGPQ